MLRDRIRQLPKVDMPSNITDKEITAEFIRNAEAWLKACRSRGRQAGVKYAKGVRVFKGIYLTSDAAQTISLARRVRQGLAFLLGMLYSSRDLSYC